MHEERRVLNFIDHGNASTHLGLPGGGGWSKGSGGASSGSGSSARTGCTGCITRDATSSGDCSGIGSNA
jgi:hypothetical protein